MKIDSAKYDVSLISISVRFAIVRYPFLFLRNKKGLRFHICLPPPTFYKIRRVFTSILGVESGSGDGTHALLLRAFTSVRRRLFIAAFLPRWRNSQRNINLQSENNVHSNTLHCTCIPSAYLFCIFLWLN